MTFSVTTPVNNQTANIHGLELQGQHFFGNSGFGVAGSLTKVFGDVSFERGSDPTTNAFALLGLSDSYNVTAIYREVRVLGARFRTIGAASSFRPSTVAAAATRSISRRSEPSTRAVSYNFTPQCVDHARGAEPDQRTDPQLRAQHAPTVVRAGAASALLARSAVQVRRNCRGFAAASASAAASAAASGDADLPGRLGDRGYGELPGSAATATSAAPGAFRPAGPVNRPYRRHGKSVAAKTGNAADHPFLGGVSS